MIISGLLLYDSNSWNIQVYFILYSENKVSKLNKIGILIDMKFH